MTTAVATRTYQRGARVYGQIRMSDGHRVTRSFMSQAEADAWCAMQIATCGAASKPEQIAERWLKADHADLSANTLTQYRSCVKAIGGALQDWPGLAERLQNAIDRLPVSRQTQCLYAIRHVAVWSQNELFIPATQALTARKAAKRNPHILSVTAIDRMLDAAQVNVYAHALLALAVHTAMRKEELLGLQWDDLLDQGQAVMVRRAVTSTGGKPLVVKEPKTPKSRRRIALNISAQTVFQNLPRRSCWVFPDANRPGQPMHPKVAYELCRPFLPTKLTFRDFRHIAPTRMLEAGVQPKVVQELMGHSSIVTTLDIYAQVVPTLHDDAVMVLDTMFSSNRKFLDATLSENAQSIY